MSGFLFRLETAEGEPAEPPTLSASRPDWPVGSLIHRGKQTLRIVGRRDDDADQAPVLIDDEVTSALDALVPLAPLHQPHNLAAIRAISAIAPNVPIVEDA